jgi:5-methylcytosine-specific restriction endonuclease McrA
MQILKPVEYKTSEDPELIKVPNPNFPAGREWKKNPNRQVHLSLWVSKSAFFSFDYDLEDWSKLHNEIQDSTVFIGQGIDSAKGQNYYFYGYKGRFFTSEIEIELTDVPLLINKEQKSKQERLQKEIDRIKAMAEAEGSVRVPIPDDVQILVWNRDGGKCVKCGSQERLEFDHIIPLSKGGSNTARNIQLLCENCNRTKQNNIGG